MEDSEHLRALLDNAKDAIVVVEESGTYGYANAAVERLLGYSPSEFVGKDAFECVHPDDRDRVRSAFERLAECDERRTETVEYRHRTADGAWAWLESRLSTQVAPDLDGYVVSSRDVTDRRRAEARERATQSRLREIAANAEDVLWMFSADWEELLFVNDAYEEIWGQSVDSLREDPGAFLEGIHPEDRPDVRAVMERLSAGESAEIEYRVNPDLDYRRWVWVKGQPIIEDGEVVRVVGFSRDITDRRRRRRQLQVMDNLLRHNLRNDMNVVLGHAETALEWADPEVAESMETIVETGRDLLETAAKDRAVIEVLVGIDDAERLDVVEVVERAVGGFRESYPDATASVAAPDGVDVFALPEIRRALGELLENAAEHATDDPRVEIRVRHLEEHVEVEIRDNAPPIPRNEFEPLFGDDADELYHGTGLGLWLVYWVVDCSDGDIEFRCPADGGNVVTVSLPRAE
jgi:PAS domain S-box-containing protein